jgi:ribonuclease R
VKKDFKKTQNKGPQTITGVISTTQKGAGYIDSADPKEESIYIEQGFLNTALNGDTVEVTVKKDGSAQVVKVINRAKESFVGIVKRENDGFIIIPDDRKMYVSIMLARHKDAIEEQPLVEDLKVQVKLLSWKDPKEKPIGKVERILGKKGVNDVEMEAIVLESGFDTNFPHQVEKEAEEIRSNQSKISSEEISKRRDMREVLTFTIDPVDAKDFDDAISFRELAGNELKEKKVTGTGPFYEIGVHIADVSHYVREGSALDKEALKRGCSVYLVDRTIPMLPEILSNELCSLRPNEEKLTFSAVFILDNKAHVHSRWFGRTVTKSAYRFTYETAQETINNKENKYSDVLNELNRLAKILMTEKFSKGAIEFESEEIKFRLNEKGEPVGVYKKERLDTHKLVEEYMLLANREVAKFITDSMKNKGQNSGSIYRIHDAPDRDKIKSLAFFVKALGYNLSTKDGVVTASALNELLDQIENTPHESLIRTAAIRSMQKAIYSTKNVGHFGLAFEFYTHFTSPIRRYPDVLVHRVLAKHLGEGQFGSTDFAKLQNAAESSTEREIDAAEAERASVKLKQVEYMSKHIGESFKGTISGVTKWGIYVEEIETKSEGMIHISELGKDYYNFDQASYSIIGEKTKQKFTLGDSVTFKVKSADPDKRMLDYGLV